MSLFKEKVLRNFDAAYESYNTVAYVQKASAQLLVKKLSELKLNFTPKTILDLGTGIGYLPELLMRLYPHSHYILNDISPNMIKFVKQKFSNNPQIEFYIGDMESVDFSSQDLIISNLALQWVHSLESTIKKMYLKSNIFAFSCLLDGTFKEWSQLLINKNLTNLVPSYPVAQELTDFLITLNPQACFFETQTFTIFFKNVYSFIKYLKNLGANTSHTSIPISAMKTLIHDITTPFSSSYQIFFGIVERRS